MNSNRGATQLRLKPLAAILASLFISGTAFSADTSITLQKADVVGTSPVPGLDRPRDEIPSNVQSIRRDRLRDTGAAGLPELLGTQLQSVNVNEIQGTRIRRT